MKKIYSLLMLLVLALTSAGTASADEYTVKVDDSSHVKLYYSVMNYDTWESTLYYVEFVDNVATVETGRSYTIEGVSPWQLKTVTASDGSYTYIYDNKCSIYCYNGGTVFDVTTYNPEEARTGRFYIDIDDASMVTARYNGSNQVVNLQNGEHEYGFIPDYETQVQISSNTYNVPLYKVELDGTALAEEGGYYFISITEGCHIKITAKIPEEPATLTFKYNETGKGAISYIELNGTKVEDWDGETLSCVTGNTVSVYPNDAYKMESYYVNGVEKNLSRYGSDYVVMGDMEFEVNAHPYGDINFTVSATHAGVVKLYNASYAGSETARVEFEGTEANMKFSENNTYLSWKASSLGDILEVLVDGQTYNYNYIEVTEGMNIQFVTKVFEFDRELVVWLDDKDALYYVSLVCQRTREEYPINTGYTIISYYEELLPFNVSYYNMNAADGFTATVLLNGETLAPAYSGGTSYNLNPEPMKNVVKLYLSTEPVDCSVNFNIAEGLSVEGTSDIINALDFAAPLSCTNGTQVSLKSTDDKKLSVTVNEEPVTPEDGEYTFVVNDPFTNVLVAEDKETGIDAIFTETEAADAAVYNLQGIRVGRAANLNNLPAGVYIVNGAKVLVK
ncbi:MAG: hypothetical protein NC098_03605 [Lachnoclostridium sp.]|nr:hypothetical protein [Lachnoclostridium sp.]